MKPLSRERSRQYTLIAVDRKFKGSGDKDDENRMVKGGGKAQVLVIDGAARGQLLKKLGSKTCGEVRAISWGIGFHIGIGQGVNCPARGAGRKWGSRGKKRTGYCR